jgi:glycosyltransferase involved in cell wall biosynthesis
MGKKNVLVIISRYKPAFGGQQSYVHEILGKFDQNKFQIDLLCCKKNADEEPIYDDVDRKFSIFQLDALFLGGLFPVPKPSWKNLRILLNLFKTKYDIVNTNMRYYTLSLFGSIFSKIKGTKHIHTEHSAYHPHLENKLHSVIGEIVDHTFGTLVVKSADLNIVVSKKTEEFVKHLGGNNIHVIPNSIDPEIFKKKKSNFKSDMKIREDVIITFVGRLVFLKNVQNLINTLHKLENVSRLKLVIVGDGPYREKLEELVNSLNLNYKVLFLGKKNHEEIVEVLNSTDIFVNPSYVEGLPHSVLEAGSIGIPIIASNVGGTNEVIENGFNGFLIEPDDINDLIKKLEKLINDDELRKEFSRRIRNTVIKNFNIHENYKKTEGIFEAV